MFQLVVKVYTRRPSLEETAHLIKEGLDKDISINYISMRRSKVRSKGRQYISSLGKNRNTYVSEYLKLIEGGKFSKSDLYQ